MIQAHYDQHSMKRRVKCFSAEKKVKKGGGGGGGGRGFRL